MGKSVINIAMLLPILGVCVCSSLTQGAAPG